MSSFIIGMILAQGGQNTAEAPDGGIGAALIVLIVLGVVAVFALLSFVVIKTTRASRGGVHPAPGEFRKGEPPFEGLHRRRR